MLRWVNEILIPHTKKDRSLLVLDSFSAHKTDAVKKALREANIVPAVIPGGCTSKLQRLVVSSNNPYKPELRKSWGLYMRTQSAEVEKGERIKPATKDEIVAWLSSATDYIAQKPELVQRSFKACGISNVLSGVEDSLARFDPGECFSTDFDDETEQDGYDDDDVPVVNLIARELKGDVEIK